MEDEEQTETDAQTSKLNTNLILGEAVPGWLFVNKIIASLGCEKFRVITDKGNCISR